MQSRLAGVKLWQAITECRRGRLAHAQAQWAALHPFPLESLTGRHSENACDSQAREQSIFRPRTRPKMRKRHCRLMLHP